MPNEVLIVRLLYAACAVAYALLTALILFQARRSRAGWLMGAACAATAVWAVLVVLTGTVELGPAAGVLDLVRSLLWYGFVLYLYRQTVGDRAQLGRVFATMGMVAVLVIVVAALLGVGQGDVVVPWSLDIAGRIGVSICLLLLLENLFLNAPSDTRWHISLPCLAIGSLCVYDIALCADAVLSHQVGLAFFGGRAIANVAVAPVLAVAAARNRSWKIDIHVSRTAAFHTATLMASGIFLLSLAGAGELFRNFGPGWGGVAENGLVFSGVLFVGVLLSSGSARSRLRRLLVEHFFTTRYDYRREWVRCIATLSTADIYVPLHSRVIRAVADIVDSPGGILFLRDPEQATFHWAGSWNMPSVSMPVLAEHPLIPGFRDGDWVVEANRPGLLLPPLDEVASAWLAVPLTQAGRLFGFILLSRPRARFTLDREVFDLLRIVAREVATHLAERRATQVLLQTRQLHDYGKRFAFVAHDIKNVSSQLSLLLSNAETHIGNPEFQRDMLATVRASVQKIGALLKRLQAPEGEGAPSLLAPVERLETIVQGCRRMRGAHLVLEHDSGAPPVTMSAGAFDAVIGHLINNAVDASPEGEPVRVVVRHDRRRVLIDIVDAGPGMTPEFVRDELFRPFGTSKREGTGIGAFQARELVREAGGDLLVFSRPGAGTTMRVMLLTEAVAETGTEDDAPARIPA